MESQKLVIDWTQMPTYNTVMSLAVGTGLILLVSFLRYVYLKKSINTDAWAMAFFVPGFILTATGLHMTLTWPLAKYFPFDNIIFGETSLSFGVLLLTTGFYLWSRGASLMATDNPAHFIAQLGHPMSIFIGGLGLALFAIACAGLRFQLFAAPPEEPITGNFAAYPWLEATAMSGLFALVGAGAVLTPFGVKEFSSESKLTVIHKLIAITWLIAGFAFLIFGALNFFTHIGLIINTMPKS